MLRSLGVASLRNRGRTNCPRMAERAVQHLFAPGCTVDNYAGILAPRLSAVDYEGFTLALEKDYRARYAEPA